MLSNSFSALGIAPFNMPHCLPACKAGRRPAVMAQAAKNVGEKKRGGKPGPKKSALADLLKKKEAGISGFSPSQPPQYNTPEARMLAFQMCDSYWRRTKNFLIEGVDFDQLPAALYRAPFLLLAHNRFQSGVTEPVFTYGNRAAMSLYEMDWDELHVTPSRTAAEDDPAMQKERHVLLDQVAKLGVVTGVDAWRVSKRGRRFKMKDAVIFTIMDRAGNKVGQAAVVHRYELEDGTMVEIAASAQQEAEAAGEVEPAIPPPEMMQAAEAAVSEQAAQVRALKEVQGMSNQDVPVQIAVLELKKRKDKLAQLQKKLDDALAASKAAFDDDDE